MFKEITIRNFKAITELTIKLMPFTVLIGENSCGKSTVLQALDFLCSLASRDIDEYLKDRKWNFEDIQSQFCAKDKPISFSARIDVGGTEVMWDIEIMYNDKWSDTNDTINTPHDSNNWVIDERITNIATGDSYLPVFNGIDLKSSRIKIMSSFQSSGNSDMTTEQINLIAKLKSILQTCESYELLSPDKIRSGNHSKSGNIGMGGEKLAANVHGMYSNTKAELSKMVSEFIGSKVKISTTTRESSGQVEMFVTEMWENKSIKTKKRYSSDGLLRIIALCAVMIDSTKKQTLQKQGFAILDEIEDGINPDLAEKLMVSFQRAATETKRQFIITSHSPVMVNYVNPENIVFMWRDAKGKIYAKPLFETPQLKEDLAYFSPGEAWYHYTKDELVKLLTGKQEDGDD